MNTVRDDPCMRSRDFRHRGHVLASVVAGLACLVLLGATCPRLPMVWDEGNAINRAVGIANWFARLGREGLSAFSQGAVEQDWRYTVEIEGHPALYGLVIAAGQALCGAWLPPLSAARFGPMLLFSFAAGAMFYRLWRDYGSLAALGGLAALLTMPRLFAHAHFASFDGPLTSCWILAWAVFPAALERRRWALVWGLALGMTMSSKFTGWLAPPVFIAWALIYADRSASSRLLLGLGVAVLTFVVFNPRLWHDPLAGTATFFELNLNRAEHHNIPTLFFGQRYDMHQPLPWYNTLIWTGITVPTGTLALSLAGLVFILRDWERNGGSVLLVGHWLVLVVARALPLAPPHDAERLFLPSFAFLAALAGVGCAMVSKWAVRRWPSQALQHWLGIAGVSAALAGSASSLCWYAPQWLSYYNVLIGGLGGADRAGLEATYYWDALDKEALDWLHNHTRPDEKILFAVAPSDNLALLRRWGELRRSYQAHEAGSYRWYVIQRRPTLWKTHDRWLAEHGHPAYQKRIRNAGSGCGAWRLDVPLLEIFSYEEYQRARKAAPEN